MLSTENRIKNSEKAAKLLTNFGMGMCVYCEVGIYFKDLAAGQIFDRNINVVGEVLDWDEDDWMRFIKEGSECYSRESKLSPDEVVSVVVQFRLNIHSKSIYSVENTDLSTVDGFDRFLAVTPETGGKYEVFFEEEDRAKIRNICYAVEIVSLMDFRRLQVVDSDLPYICLHGNNH